MKSVLLQHVVGLLFQTAAVSAFVSPLVLLTVPSSSSTTTTRRSFVAVGQDASSSSSSLLRRYASSVEEDVSPESSSSSSSSNSNWIEPPTDVFPDAEFYTFQLVNHKPLGCTVEETLAEQQQKYVFVSKVVEGSHADEAGIQVGDVLFAVTGLFGKATAVLEEGVDKIKGLVGSVKETDPLVLQIARGTGVYERHEMAVVDLCQTTSVTDKEVENCVVDFLSEGYDYTPVFGDDDEFDDGDDDEIECVSDDDESECMLDGMMEMWADELPMPSTTSGITDQPVGENTGKKAKPWSSRSSPSGTFVRDPVTGEMRNIDA